jgi:Protein of unknown function (DUF3108)
VALLVLAICACGGKRRHVPWNPDKPYDHVDEPPFISPGERMTYRVTVLKVEVAEFTIAIGEPKKFGNYSAIAIRAAAHTSGIAALVRNVKAEFTSFVDAATGRALAFRVEETAGKDDSTVETMDVRFLELADGKFPVTMIRPADDDDAPPTKLVEQQVTTGVPVDLLTLLMQLRSWEKPGKRTVEAVRSRYIWRTEIRLAGRETVKTELGNLPALRFEAESRRINRNGTYDQSVEPRKLEIWISDDADRVPIKIVAPTEYGQVVMSIAEYTPGTLPNLASVARTH